MRGILPFCLLAFICPRLSAQYVYTIKADSVKITNCDSAELILENHTQGVPGFLFNNGNGRTIFRRGLTSLGNGSYLIGADTLKAWVQGGNSWGATGVLGTLDNNHLDLYTSDTMRARLTNRGKLLIGTSTDNGQALQVAGTGYFSGNVGFGQTSPAAPIDILQSLSGSSAAGAINLASMLNTTGAPTAFNLAVTNTASGTGSNLVNILQDGISRLKIPIGTARVVWEPNGLQINTTNAVAGGITLNGSAAASNQLIVSPGFALFNSSTVSVGGTNAITLTAGSNVAPPSGTSHMVNITGTFNPTSGSGSGAALAIQPIINQTGGASGTTWGMYINPTLTAAAWRAMEVTNGNSYFGTTSGHVLMGTSTTDNGNLLQVNGNIYTSSYLTNTTTALGTAGSGGSIRLRWGTGDGNYMGFYKQGNTNRRGFIASESDTRPMIFFDSVGFSLLNTPWLCIGTEIGQTARLSVIDSYSSGRYDLLVERGSTDSVSVDMVIEPPGTVLNSLVDNGAITEINGRTVIGGRLGVGVPTPTAQLHTSGTVRFAGLTQDSTQIRVLVCDTSGNLFYRSASSLAIDEPLRSSLAVNGTIRARQLRLQPEGWADYVFDKNYRLPDLPALENYILQNHHLPGIASAADVREDGVDVGETQTALLRKIEELTLYTIDQDKKLSDQQKEIDILKAKMEKLEQLLETTGKTGLIRQTH